MGKAFHREEAERLISPESSEPRECAMGDKIVQLRFVNELREHGDRTSNMLILGG